MLSENLSLPKQRPETASAPTRLPPTRLPPTGPLPLARLRGLRRSYAMGRTRVTALDGVTLDLPAGAFCVLAGASGSGKSTLLHHLGCLERADAGDIEVLGQDLMRLDETQMTRLRRARIGFVFQSFSLIPVLSAAENVEYPLLLQRVQASERRARVAEMLAAVGLEARAHHRPAELSGGQRQRVAVARALIGAPDLVLADEPTANLDSRTGAGLMAMLCGLQRDRGTSFVIASHDPAVIARADHVVRLVDGRILAEG